MIALMASLLYTAKPALVANAQTATSATVTSQPAVQSSNFDDFENDVKKGKDATKQDAQAQKLQKEVVDGEDGQAGEGDGQNNQEDLNIFGDIQNAENNQGVNEDNQDINNSGIDEVDDSNNLDSQSEDIMNEHQVQEEGDMNNQGDSGSATSSEQNSGSDQSLPDGQNN